MSSSIVRDLNETLTGHGYAIIAANDPQEAAIALARIASAYLLSGSEVFVIDGSGSKAFDHLIDEGAEVAASPSSAAKLLDEAIRVLELRRSRTENQGMPWHEASNSERPPRVIVLVDAYEETTRSAVGLRLRLAEKATKIAEQGANFGVFLVGFMRTVNPADVQR